MNSNTGYMRIRRQRLLVLHPSGTLQLHHLDFNASHPDGSSTTTATSPYSTLSTVLSPREAPLRMISALGISPGSPTRGQGFGGGGKGGGAGAFSLSPPTLSSMQSGKGGGNSVEVKATTREVVVWSLTREDDWKEVFCPVRSIAARIDAINRRPWASAIEISTYDPIASGGPPLWSNANIAFHVFQDGEKNKVSGRPRPGQADLSRYPPTRRVLEGMGRKVVIPYGGVTGKTLTLYPSLAEQGPAISSAISSAMAHELDKASVTVRDGLSFEDAFVIDDVVGKGVMIE